MRQGYGTGGEERLNTLTNTKHGWFASTKTNVNHGACAGEGRPSVVGLARALDVAGARVK